MQLAVRTYPALLHTPDAKRFPAAPAAQLSATKVLRR
ncbi:hypothetical protein XACM_2057 [Xanthomonas euvesicatoria pv. citrumelo F1]|nr:hypothetical protein XACM_2057 [Xanthomonas euvesicatoria pv. citrumelo F1]